LTKDRKMERQTKYGKTGKRWKDGRTDKGHKDGQIDKRWKIFNIRTDVGTKGQVDDGQVDKSIKDR
jgi:hypothetical protein